MGPPGALNNGPVYLVRAGPALRGAQDDHRPPGLAAHAVFTRVRLNLPDLAPCGGQRLREAVVHAGRIAATYFDDLVTVALVELAQILWILAPLNGGARDLCAVEVQDRQHGPVSLRIEERDSLPRALEWTGFCLTIAHNGERDEIRVIEHGAKAVDQTVSELAALIDGAGSCHRDV